MRLSHACFILALTVSCRNEAASTSSGAASATHAPARLTPLAPGEAAPDFSALSQTGYTVTLSQLLEKPVAVYFCVNGLGPACTALVTALRDGWLSINQRLGMALLVAPTGYNENRAFATEHELPILVLADTDRAIASAYGLYPAANATNESMPPAIGFLVAPDQKVLRVFSNPEVAAHVPELAGALR
jgi:peroxiredoxin Q/BCP